MCRKKAHGNEAVARADVGDKLQSCEQKRFKASAKGDKSTPPCSTNHCSLDGHAPGGRAAPWLHATPNADHALPPDARHIGMKNTVFFAWDRTKKKTNPFFCPQCAACDSQRDKNTQKRRKFPYLSGVITAVFRLSPARKHTHARQHTHALILKPLSV